MKLGFPLLPPGISKIKIGEFTRNAAGNQAITGVGFAPKVVLFFAYATGGTNQIGSWGFDNGASPSCLWMGGDSVDLTHYTNRSIFVRKTAVNILEGYIASMDSDGFTVTWALTGAVTAFGIYLAMR